MPHSTQNRNIHPAVPTTAQAVVLLIDIDAIEIGERLRALQPDKVDEIAASIRDVGRPLHPIVVRPRPGGFHIKKYVLVVGRHRLEAAKKAGAKTILATIADMDAATAELAEIDENLIRAELSPAERALHLARRKEIYEEQHPETRKGSAGGRAKAGRDAKSQDATKQAPAFIDDTAKKTGKHRATIAREVARAIPNLADAIGTSLDQGAELDALAKLPQPEQAALISRAKAGEKVTAKATKGNAAAKAPRAESAAGNDVDPEKSAEQRKAEAAAAEAVQPEQAPGVAAKPPKKQLPPIDDFAEKLGFFLALIPSPGWKQKLDAIIEYREDMTASKRNFLVGALRALASRASGYADKLEGEPRAVEAAPDSRAPAEPATPAAPPAAPLSTRAAEPVEMPAFPPFLDPRAAESVETTPAEPTKH